MVYNREQGKVKTMDFSRQTCSKELEDCSIDRKGDGCRFLGFTKSCLHGIPRKGQNSRSTLLCRLVGRFRCRIAKYHRRRHCNISELGYELLSIVFSRFGPVPFFFFTKKSVAEKFVESNTDVIATTEAYFADLKKKYFSDEIQKLKIVQSSVSSQKRGPCWGIQRHFSTITG